MVYFRGQKRKALRARKRLGDQGQRRMHNFSLLFEVHRENLVYTECFTISISVRAGDSLPSNNLPRKH